MRDLKFKAWHLETKTMYWFDVMNANVHGNGSGYISMCLMGEDITKDKFKDNMIAVDPNDCEIMEFTGMYDRNGNEIYECDIISNAPFNKHLLTDMWHEVVYRNRWEGNSLTHHSICGGQSIDDISKLDKHFIEVIGNVFENPELLTAVGGKEKINS